MFSLMESNDPDFHLHHPQQDRSVTAQVLSFFQSQYRLSTLPLSNGKVLPSHWLMSYFDLNDRNQQNQEVGKNKNEKQSLVCWFLSFAPM